MAALGEGRLIHDKGACIYDFLGGGIGHKESFLGFFLFKLNKPVEIGISLI